MSLIQLNNISKHYQMGDQLVRALDDVSLTIKQNEYLAFIGASGSGKSTMMNILGCLDTPTSGHYVLNGLPTDSMDESQLADIRNKEVGFIFQNFSLLPRADALANVMQPLIYRNIDLTTRKSLAIEALEKVSLADRLDHLPNQLSGGQRQRVAIARALVTNPSILLADEPTGNLDSKTTVDIMQLFDQLHKEGQTIIMVTHEDDIANHCQRNIKMQDGKVIEDNSTDKSIGSNDNVV
ncbi:MAG: ABC transporter ATP-binding protein [Kangiellaceae bacterium]|nr:ABC transporter ATP-binding protein [Kangiellaceae bacterium]